MVNQKSSSLARSQAAGLVLGSPYISLVPVSDCSGSPRTLCASPNSDSLRANSSNTKSERRAIGQSALHAPSLPELIAVEALLSLPRARHVVEAGPSLDITTPPKANYH